ncbi:hypothetical protein [Desulfonatronospira sp.]|uniref:VgrG-related protein n=1 Tax=Desulfonatronospira sp. TaxID=1962951 RepID=UPI0025B8872D|nr:hypothetical protein [Desulfonatronospira sp.]
MIINHPDYGMNALQERLSEKAQAPAENIQDRLFDLIMNKKLATAPPSTVPTVSIPRSAGILLDGAISHAGGDVSNSARTFSSGNRAEAGEGRSGEQQSQGHTLRRKIDFQATHPEHDVTESGRQMPGQIRDTLPGLASRIVNTMEVSGSRVPQQPVISAFIDSMRSTAQPDISSSKNKDTGAEKITAAETPDVTTAGLNQPRHVKVSELTLDKLPETKGQGTGVLQADLERPASTEPVQVTSTALGSGTDKDPPNIHPGELNPGAVQKERVAKAYQGHAAYRPYENISTPGETRQEKQRPGRLAARFESANRSDAIGYDHRGGTCYGIYQLSSNMGTMGEFLEFLEARAPELARRLKEAGPLNACGRTGEVPREWQKIDREHPALFPELQHEFIHETFFMPAARGVESRTGLNMEQASPALREVLWSTAVQHGVHGSMNIFERAAEKVDFKNVDTPDRDMIQAVYHERSRRFTSSSEAVQSAVQNRFKVEMQMALAMLPGAMDAQA